jgi:hypothetical protein
VLINTARKLYADESSAKRSRPSMPGFHHISLSSPLFPGPSSGNHGTIKLHTVLEVQVPPQNFIDIHSGEAHDVKVLDRTS